MAMAKKSSVHIMGSGVRNAVRVFAVSSGSNSTSAHLVFVIADRLSCDCAAAKYGKQCSHRTLVQTALAAEAPQRSKTGLLDANYNRPIGIFK